MIRAAAYVRISTAGQDEDSGGAGEEAQRQTIERIALEHELEIVEWFWEQASGAFLERPQLTRLIQGAEDGQFNALIISAADRLARDAEAGGYLRFKLRELGVTIYDQTGKQGEGWADRMVQSLMGYVAEFEKMKIRERTMAGKKVRAMRDNTLPVGTGPGLFGYDYHPRERGKEGAYGRRTINEAEAVVVRRVFDLALENKGQLTIARMLNADGVASKTGKQWHAKSIMSMMSNPAYKGVTEYGRIASTLMARGKRKQHRRADDDVITIEGFTPPIVTVKEWDTVQALRVDRRGRRTGKSVLPYMLSDGLLTCASCGMTLTARTQKGRWRYYQCRGCMLTATRPAICTTKAYKAEPIEQAVWKAVKRWLRNPDAILASLEHQDDTPATPKADSQREPLQREAVDLSRQQAALLEAIKAAPAAASAINTELNQIARALNETHQRLQSIDKAAEGASQAFGILKQVMDELKRRLNTADSIEQQKEALKRLCFRASVNSDGSILISIRIPDGSGALLPDRGKKPEVNPIHHWTNMGMTTWM